MPTAYIGMGANLPSCAGPPEATLAAAAARLGELGRVIRRSSLYRTEPVGFAGQPSFVNAVVALDTTLAPRPLLEGLLTLERAFGRDRSASIPLGPRTLDLDLLLYDTIVLNEPDLVLPHPRLAERAFVLVPLCEIDPKVFHASSGQPVSQLLVNLNRTLGPIQNAVLQISFDGWRAGGSSAGPGESCVPGPGDDLTDR
ncbi:MAG: 2-amino-4-hydroxy-6-hydroxymethyldihydropteridine diphosphokinase [Terracidiphilus sp.]